MVLGNDGKPERSRSPRLDLADLEESDGAGLDFGRGRSAAPDTSARGPPSQTQELPPGQHAKLDQINTESVEKIVANAFNKQIGSFRDSMAAALDTPIRNVVQDACSAQLAAVDGRLSKLETGQNKLETGQAQLLVEVAKINKALAKMAHSPSAPDLTTAQVLSQPRAADVTTPTFWRKLDPTVLFINTHDRVKVNMRTIYKSVVQLATEANIGEADYIFNGDALDNLFDLKFTGALAAQHCQQFFHSLQLGRGRWKTQECQDPTGTTHKFYIATDKNPAMVRKEVLTKHLKTAISGMEGWTKEIFVRKSSGTLLVDRRPLVSISIVDEDRAALVWTHANRINLSLDQATIETMFQNIVTGGSRP